MLVPPLFLIFIDDNKIRFCMYSVCFVNTNNPCPKKARASEKALNI